MDASTVALGFEGERERNSYVRQVLKLVDGGSPVDNPLRLVEHKNGVFTVHGARDVELVAQLGIESVHAVEKLGGGGGGGGADDGEPRAELQLPTLRLNQRLAADLVAQALTAAGRKVELWQRQGASLSVRARGSPAEYEELEELLHSSGQGSRKVYESTVVAVKSGTSAGARVLGVAVCDVIAREVAVGEFQDDEVYSHLELVLVSAGAKEVLFCAGDFSEYESLKVGEVLGKISAARTERRRSEFAADEIESELRILLGARALDATPFLSLPQAMSATACLIRFLNLIAGSSTRGAMRMVGLHTNTHMALDLSVMRALNILPEHGSERDRGSSLLALLSRAKTTMGTRLLRRWLSQPLQDADDINARLDLVETLLLDASLRQRLREEHLRRTPDLTAICRKLQRKSGSASLQDVVRLYQFSVRLPFLRQCLGEHGDAAARERLRGVFVQPLKELSDELANFEALVETTIDLAQIDNHEFVINPNIDSDLSELKERKDKVLGDISEVFEEVQRVLEVESDRLKLERKDNLGYIFRLTRREEKLIRGRSAFIILETRKDGVRFTNAALRRLSNEYSALAEEYEGKQAELRRKTLDVVASYLPVFEDCAALLARLDVLATFANVAADAPQQYCRPTIAPAASGLRLSRARHPIVEESQEQKAFIANDVDLRRSTSPSEEDGADSAADEGGGATVIVTGPNMGGKSTYIRAAAVITLMAHVGCFVPAERAVVPLTDRILARVGASDNPQRGVSTFMAEMLDTAAILRGATHRSLVVIDELGRGTSTYDGFGLAYAIAEHIATELRASCLFATHFHELTALARRNPGVVRNLHVTATNDSAGKLVFLYEVRPGACDRSFGIHVAEMAGFPAEVVEAARRKAQELEDFGVDADEMEIESEREDGADGDKRHRAEEEFLGALRTLPLENLAAQEAFAAVRQLQEKLLPDSLPTLPVI